MTNLDNILNSRDITLPKKVHIVKAMALPVVMYGCESWTVKKAERWWINAFELRCYRRFLRVLWTTKRPQSILKEINLEYSLEGPMLKVKLQYFGNLMQRADSLEKILMLGKIEGRRRREQQRMRWLDGITDSMHRSWSKLREIVNYLPDFAQTHVHWIGDAIHPSHPVSYHSHPAFNLSQHQGLL